MPYVKQMRLRPKMHLSELAKAMEGAGVLGAGRFAKTVRILSEMFGDRRYSNFLAFAGPLVPGGLRAIIHDLIRARLIHGIITTGANVTHDLVEAFGHRHIIGTEQADDRQLRRKNLSRIFDIYITQKAIEALERKTYRMLDRIPEDKRRDLGSYELLNAFGRQIKDRASILRASNENEVPVFCPGIFDSMLGLHLWTYSRLKTLRVNPMRDFTKLVEMSFEAKKTGVVILGGGMPKHHIMAANIYRGGIDAAIQITLDRPEGGGTSGAPLEEAISWGKIRNPHKLATLIGDASLLFPLAVLAALERAGRKL